MEMLLMKMDKTDDDTKYLVSHVDDARRESIPEGWGQSRMELFEKMEKTALEYAKLLLQTQQLRALDRPSNRDFESVKDFVTDDGGTLSDEIYVKEDLVTLAPKRDYPCVERMPRRAALEYDALDVSIFSLLAINSEDTECSRVVLSIDREDGTSPEPCLEIPR